MTTEIAEVFADCQAPNWDGYGALSVSRAAADAMDAFLASMPPGGPRPALGADPDGCLTAEWYYGPGRVLNVSVDASGVVSWASSGKVCGTGAARVAETLASWTGECEDIVYNGNLKK